MYMRCNTLRLAFTSMLLLHGTGPRPCWDKTHGHELGGGDHWVTGYAEMLRQARAAAGGTKILLTESNSEPFMGGINLFLTLVGFSTGDLPGGLGSTIMVPAFQAVYGGYVLPIGAEFFRDDFLPVRCANQPSM
eukprot:COSAG02_NODE_2591_length_8466_cov_26.224095_5_plen_134_part_00